MQPVSIANDISRLRNFKFNPHTEVSSRWKVAINVMQAGADEIVVQLPAFIPATQIAAPSNTVNVECTIAAASVSVLMAENENAGSDHFSMLIPHDREMMPAQSISLALPAKPGCLVVVAASMKYHLVTKKTDTRLSFLPSSVIGAWYVE
jgi:sensor c-di-GMP phosphodiesterase-like protein